MSGLIAATLERRTGVWDLRLWIHSLLSSVILCIGFTFSVQTPGDCGREIMASALGLHVDGLESMEKVNYSRLMQVHSRGWLLDMLQREKGLKG